MLSSVFATHTVTVNITDSEYPQYVAILSGQPIRWNNNSNLSHTITSGTPAEGPDNLFDSWLFPPGSSFELYLQDLDIWPVDEPVSYFCIVHPWETGIIEVGIDSDGDSLFDSWESQGIDINKDGIVDLDLPSLGADPQHKDVFVEIDYMEFHRPRSQVIDHAVERFRQAPLDNPDDTTGINLHILVDEQIPHQDLLPIWSGFDNLKETYFGTSAERLDENTIEAKKLVYRYSLFIHQRDDVPGSSGKAERPGNDFLVSLGSSGWGTDSNGHNVGSVDEQRGTFMHELGHTFGLQHGGPGPINCKPNYLSVMNYAYQISIFIPEDQNLQDYSRETFSDGAHTLNEANLNENEGVFSSFWPTVVYGPRPLQTDSTNAPINWDRDDPPTFVDSTSADVNNFGFSGCNGFYEILMPYNDWSTINNKFNFRVSHSFGDGIHIQETEQKELTIEMVTEMRQIAQEDLTVDSEVPDDPRAQYPWQFWVAIAVLIFLIAVAVLFARR